MFGGRRIYDTRCHPARARKRHRVIPHGRELHRVIPHARKHVSGSTLPAARPVEGRRGRTRRGPASGAALVRRAAYRVHGSSIHLCPPHPRM